MESHIPNVVPIRLISERTVPTHQSVSTSCLLDHQKKTNMQPKKIESFCTFPSSDLMNSPLRSSPQNVLASMTTFELDSCPFAVLSDRHWSCKTLFPLRGNSIKNAGQTTLPYHQDIIYSQIKVSWSHTDLSLVGSI